MLSEYYVTSIYQQLLNKENKAFREKIIFIGYLVVS